MNVHDHARSVAALVAAAAGVAHAQTLTLRSAAVASGGVVTGGEFRAHVVLGQPVAGRAAGSEYVVRVGFLGMVEEPCPADRTGDGRATVDDLLAFLGAFRLGTADFDGNGTTDVGDLLAYLGAFRAGCV